MHDKCPKCGSKVAEGDMIDHIVDGDCELTQYRAEIKDLQRQLSEERAKRGIATVALIAGALILMICSAAIGVWFGMDVMAFNRDMVAVGEVQPPLSHGVELGDTFWSIARRYYNPNRYDIRHVVWTIEEMNPHLEALNIRPGDTVFLPRFEEVR